MLFKEDEKDARCVIRAAAALAACLFVDVDYKSG
jgi:hypothetical protein